MANMQKKIKKNLNTNKKEKENEYPLKDKVLSFVKPIYIMIILSILIYLITAIKDGKYKIDYSETSFDYSKILAGQTFNRKEEEYYVVFYDFKTQSELKELISKITTVKIYGVDLSLGNNKSILSDVGNPNASSANELKVNGTTLIKINSGNNYEYVEGVQDVKSYLNSL